MVNLMDVKFRSLAALLKPYQMCIDPGFNQVDSDKNINVVDYAMLCTDEIQMKIPVIANQEPGSNQLFSSWLVGIAKPSRLLNVGEGFLITKGALTTDRLSCGFSKVFKTIEGKKFETKKYRVTLWGCEFPAYLVYREA